MSKSVNTALWHLLALEGTIESVTKLVNFSRIISKLYDPQFSLLRIGLFYCKTPFPNYFSIYILFFSENVVCLNFVTTFADYAIRVCLTLSNSITCDALT